MSVRDTKDFDTLCQSARDIARQATGLIEELRALHAHAPAEPHAHPDQADRQIVRIRDQITLLAATIDDIDRVQRGV